MFLWTDEAVQQLRKLWIEGVSTGDIGRELGCGKNAAVGKAHRLNLPRRRASVDPKLIAARLRARQNALQSASANALGVSILGLQPGMCKWPVGGDDEHLFCGHAWSGERGPYCAEHKALAYVPAIHRVRMPREPRRRSASIDWMEAA